MGEKKQKQIEEIANVIYDDPNAYDTYWRSHCERLAETIYNAGYRKQSEGEWVDNYNGTFTCTVCGARASKMNYCGRCGAKMRKHEEVKDYPPYLDRPKMKGGAE